ncbi:hypothetical protein [Cohnella candidum]|uniref:NERD domain-containing protein n=1 Tax=Cohnella candidum TaxID=2674991 RepID=A0A3G3JSH8_9BACL|nr:hypothetical protein [Cohnella candidum]AYQ71142.1 hypothetical protein EAV92_00060 [Cohnella candidum]
MLAEIHRKISRSGSNLSDRLEDKLTGDFFGAIRYMPFEVAFQHVMRQVRFHNDDHQLEWNAVIDKVAGYEAVLDFWPSHSEGEIDLLLRHSDAYVGIEVKYFSSLSSVDEEDEESIRPEESKNQLVRYARMLKEIGKDRPKFLVFLAPYNILFPVEHAMQTSSVLLEDVPFGYLGWQDVLSALEQIDLQPMPYWQAMIINDLKALLVRKGFVHYKGLPESLLHTELTDEAYQYCKQDIERRGYLWPAHDTIEQEDSYVYHQQ